jgi:hypothetical protein
MSWTITPQTKVPVDPVFNNVSLLLHGNGTNGSTTITDNSPSPKTVTAVGNAQISTAQSKFGGSSIAFDGTDDYVTTNASTAFAFGTLDYTVEGWFYFLTLTSNSRLITFSNDADNLDMASSNRIAYYNGSAQTFSTNNALTSNVWQHIALVRLSGTAVVYVNGISVLSQAVTPNTSASRFLGLGGTGSIPLNFNGYIDDFRITKGIARYTANFTPPAAPFPDI